MKGVIRTLLSELSSGDDRRAEAAVAEIAAISEDQAKNLLGKLREILSSSDTDTRWWAIRAISEISDDCASSLLTKALDDQDSSVRQCAALGMRSHPDSQSIPALLCALADNDGLVARLASNALVEIGGEAVPGLIEVMQTGAQAARLEAARALATIGDQRSVPVLFAALEEDSALLEYWANEGLERMGVGMVYFCP
jgi:HEAT repeat protein